MTTDIALQCNFFGTIPNEKTNLNKFKKINNLLKSSLCMRMGALKIYSYYESKFVVSFFFVYFLWAGFAAILPVGTRIWCVREKKRKATVVIRNNIYAL